MDCKGKNPMIVSVVSPSNNFHLIRPLVMPSKTCHKMRKPSANAERLTNIPKKRQKEKKPISFTKKARTNSKSEKIMDSSSKSEYMSPRIRDTTKTKTVEIKAKEMTVKNLDRINSFFESPSIRFCFIVLLLYSLAIMDTMTMAKKSLKTAVTKVLKCHMYGKLKMPISAK
jgi:hypothetical protein